MQRNPKNILPTGSTEQKNPVISAEQEHQSSVHTELEPSATDYNFLLNLEEESTGKITSLDALCQNSLGRIASHSVKRDSLHHQVTRRRQL